MSTENTGRALESYRKRVEEHPDSASAQFNLALAYTQRGRPDRAEEHYRKALEIEPDLVEAWVNLGGVKLLKWDFHGCIAANEEALKRREDLLLAHYNIGQASLYLADTEGVLRSYRRVVELDPGHAAGRYYLAVGLLSAGRVTEAEEELARAKALGHSPAPEFLKALNEATQKLSEATDPVQSTDNGANAPDQPEEK
jgi:tetratricopeptide (TPR) repeat protein